MRRFDRFVGVDQTGAARAGGQRAAPLPVAVLEQVAGVWTLTVDDGGRPASVARLEGASWGADAAVLVDAVLGLPEACWDRDDAPADLRDLWARAAIFAHEGRRYGRAVAHAFLDTLRVPGAEHRRCDARAGAQPVFRAMPFQRDVGTGSYRVWRDLAGQDVAVWPFDAMGRGPVVAECWPRLGWRHLLGRATRDPAALVAGLDELDVRAGPATRAVLARSADHADAAVNALHGRWLQDRGALFPTIDPPAGEGWIVGLDAGAAAPPGD